MLRQTRPAGHDIKVEIHEMLTLVKEEKKAEEGGWRDLATPWIRRLVIIGIGLGAVQQLTGVNTLMYYAPTILTQTGLATEDALTASIANGVVSVVASAVGLYLVGVLRRRTLLITGQIGIVASLLAVGVTFHFLVAPGLEPGQTPSPAGSYTVLAFMLTFLLFQQGAVSPVTWIMLSEIFPMKMRGFGVGVAVFLLWIFNAAIAFTFPMLIDAIGGSATFLLFAGINVGTVIFSWRMVPETSDRTLEQLEADFRHHYDEKVPQR